MSLPNKALEVTLYSVSKPLLARKGKKLHNEFICLGCLLFCGVAVSCQPHDREHSVRDSLKKETGRFKEIQPAFEPNELNPDVLDALDFLEQTDLFSGIHVSSGGVTSDEACAFNIISRSDKFKEILCHLYANGTHVGKLYALIGMYAVDKENFDIAYSELEQSDEEVNTLSGCIRSTRKIVDILKSDAPNAPRLNEKYPTIESWLEANNPKEMSFQQDIFGGSYTERFMTQSNCEPRSFGDVLLRRARSR